MEINPLDYKNEISSELNKILSHSLFKAAKRSRSFLNYICEKTLQGESHQIKEFSIAVDAFNLEMSFDQQIDPRIRVEAKRLRDRLKQYYEGPGRNDSLRICMEKGSYVPCFQVLEQEQQAEAEEIQYSRGEINPETAQSILVDQRFLINIEIQKDSSLKNDAAEFLINRLIHNLFILSRSQGEALSISRMLKIEDEALPLTLIIQFFEISNKIIINLKIKLKERGLLLLDKELKVEKSVLNSEFQIQETAEQEAGDLLSFCRSIQS